MTHKNRLAAWARLVCAVFVLACFLSAGFEAAYAGHSHDNAAEEDCVQCLLLHSTREGRRLLAGTVAAALCLAAAFAPVRCLPLPKSPLRSATPVLLCDRIDS